MHALSNDILGTSPGRADLAYAYVGELQSGWRARFEVKTHSPPSSFARSGPLAASRPLPAGTHVGEEKIAPLCIGADGKHTTPVPPSRLVSTQAENTVSQPSSLGCAVSSEALSLGRRQSLTARHSRARNSQTTRRNVTFLDNGCQAAVVFAACFSSSPL